MRRKRGGIAPGLAVMLATSFAAPPAWADFYTLDGKFACLSSGEATCANHSRDTLVPPKPASADATNDTAAPSHDPLLQAPPTLAPVQPATPHDTIADIGIRVAAGKASSDDLGRLRVLSRGGDGRAIELLAWCDYFGIGVPRDPVAAYIMYGVAALAGIAGASANQAVIYEYVLTPDQRQMVLDIQNDDIDAATAP